MTVTLHIPARRSQLRTGDYEKSTVIGACPDSAISIFLQGIHPVGKILVRRLLYIIMYDFPADNLVKSTV